MLRLATPGIAEEAKPVAVHDARYCPEVVTSIAEHGRYALKVGDGIQIAGGLLAAKATVQVGANGSMTGVAGQLTDSVDVIDHGRQLELGIFHAGLAADPIGIRHAGCAGGNCASWWLVQP